MDAATAAISDPVRRDILMLLRTQEMSAGEIARHFEISRPAISRHLRVLRESGLVVDQVRGRHRLYRLELRPLAPLEEWLLQLRDVWSGPLDALETEVYRTKRERRMSGSRDNLEAASTKDLAGERKEIETGSIRKEVGSAKESSIRHETEEKRTA